MINIFQYPSTSLQFLTLQYMIGVNGMRCCKFRVRDCLFTYKLFQLRLREAVVESQPHSQGHSQKNFGNENSIFGSQDKIMINFH